MNNRKIELKQDRLKRVQTRVEARKKILAAKGLDEKRLESDTMVRHLLAEVRKIQNAIETIKWEPPKAAPTEAKAEKPAKEASAPKPPKAPKEKKPAKEAPAPTG